MSARGWIHTASQSGEVFANTEQDDLIIRTSTATQRLLLGPARAGRLSAVQVGANAVTLNTPTIMNGRLFIGSGGVGSGAVVVDDGGGSSGNSSSAAALADYAVTTRKLADGAVTSQKVDDAAITASKIAAAAVTRSHLGPGSVDSQALALLCVDTPNLADACVTSAQLAPGSVTWSRLDPSLTTPLFDLWALVVGSAWSNVPSSSPCLYGGSAAAAQASSNAYLTLVSSSSSSSSQQTTTMLDPSSGEITFPRSGVYDVTSSLHMRSSAAAAAPPSSSWFAPTVWQGRNDVLYLPMAVRLGYAEGWGVVRSSFTGAFAAGDSVKLTVSSADNWWLDSACNASYVSIVGLPQG